MPLNGGLPGHGWSGWCPQFWCWCCCCCGGGLPAHEDAIFESVVAVYAVMPDSGRHPPLLSFSSWLLALQPAAAVAAEANMLLLVPASGLLLLLYWEPSMAWLDSS